jgi:hypothetical protein
MYDTEVHCQTWITRLRYKSARSAFCACKDCTCTDGHGAGSLLAPAATHPHPHHTVYEGATQHGLLKCAAIGIGLGFQLLRLHMCTWLQILSHT